MIILMILIAIVIIAISIMFYFHSCNMVVGSTNETINPDNLTTLDRMRFTAIQMTILDLETSTPTNISNDEIASEIYKYQQQNTTDRLTTFEIEDLYRNITNGTQVGPEIQ
jgi:type IV secretory pathway VirB6-like protein